MDKLLHMVALKARAQAVSSRISAFFNRLQWKLTLTYTLFTVVTILIIAGIALAFLWYFNFYSASLPSRIAEGLLKAGPSIAPYLDHSPPNKEGLQYWLQQVTQDNNLVINIPMDDSNDDSEKVPAQFGRVAAVVIVDATGIVLAATPPEAAEPDAPLATQLAPETLAGFNAALQGETEAARLSYRDPNGFMIASAPVFDPKKKLLGAIYVKLTFPVSQGEYLQLVLQNTILPVALIMVLVGILAGLLFGYLTARGLTRRLRRLDQAADAWSQGDFSVLAADSSRDELGQLARHLNAMALQLEDLLHTRQELATLEERNRLARDLHDSVKQQIFATAMQVGAAKALAEAKPAEAKTHLEEADQLVRQAQRELTGLIQELRPAALEGQGLAGALKAYAADWSRQTNIAAEVRVSGQRSLALPLEQTLFRIAQEALANVARHSKASRAEIYLGWENGNVTLIISDDGCGFDSVVGNGYGLGLQSMQERVETLNGTLAVESLPGAGTQVMAQLTGNAEFDYGAQP